MPNVLAFGLSLLLLTDATSKTWGMTTSSPWYA
jgi:hypothetical protein